MFIFAGRKPNVEIALPFYQRILDENPDTELHIWDLARDRSDSRYLRSIETSDRLQVRTEFAHLPRGINRVWSHYARPEYQDCAFVKADDDVLFIETDRFSAFLNAVEANPDYLLSARVYNNGACTFLEPDIQSGFETLGLPLLDVHLSVEYADLSHRWFFANWQTALNREPRLVTAPSWLSINLIGMTWTMLRQIASLIGTRSPAMIFDRHFPRRNARGRLVGHTVGDEGASNLQPMLLFNGMCAAHATFGPQEELMTDAQLTEYRKNFADIAIQYLS